MKKNLLEWLSEALLTLTAIPMLAMMVHVTLDVILKYTISTPIQGTLEITAYYYMVSVVVLPLAFVELTRQSIAVELFYQMMSSGLQVAVIGFVLLLSAVTYAGLAVISIPDALRAFEMKEIVMGTVNIYIWPMRFVLPAGLILAAAITMMLFFRLLFSSHWRHALTVINEHDPDAEGH
ncbi:TRAP transporter small permease subunit [Antarctobacter sp.]|uniref:TRAP transporter small permease subunit n=1 Tax=Antarctobacter sp. TaxID=1872577 RepID=UPI003A930014